MFAMQGAAQQAAEITAQTSALRQQTDALQVDKVSYLALNHLVAHVTCLPFWVVLIAGTGQGLEPCSAHSQSVAELAIHVCVHTCGHVS